MINRFSKAYYMDGVSAGISNYVNYSWKENLTMPMAENLIRTLGLKRGDSFLDVGCARGFLVKALRRLGIDAWGCDISEWAVENCDPEVKGFIHLTRQHQEYDFVHLKDCGEHIDPDVLAGMVDELIGVARKEVLIIVPLSTVEGGEYVRHEDNLDATHIIRWPLESWLHFLCSRSMPTNATVTASWHIPGLKPTSLSSFKSCGFFTISK